MNQRASDGSYYAQGRTVRRAPLEKPLPQGGKSISIGFPVCVLHDAVGDEAAVIIADAMNLAHRMGEASEQAQRIESSSASVAEADIERYHGTIIGALNDAQKNYELLGVPLFEAIARVIAQLTDGAPPEVARGIITFISTRANNLRGAYSAGNTEATHFLAPEGRA